VRHTHALSLGSYNRFVRVEPVRILRRAYLFRDLGPAELEPLAASAAFRHFDRGERIAGTGDPATSLFVVAEGQVRSWTVTADGEEYVFDVTTTGGVLGEPGLFAPGRTRVVNMSAMGPAGVLEIPRQVLIDFLFAHRPAMLRMLEGLAGSTRLLAMTNMDLAYEPVAERVARRLLDLAASNGVERDDGALELDVSVSQTTLAGMVGASRPNVNRALQRLVADGDLQLQGGRFVLLAPGRLQSRLDRGLGALDPRNRRSEPEPV